jgi:hypothetical protein
MRINPWRRLSRQKKPQLWRVKHIEPLTPRQRLGDLFTDVQQSGIFIDSKTFDELREVFTKDAHVDYSAFGGGVGNLEDTIAYLKQAVADTVFPNTQHLNANIHVTLRGDDSASGRVMCFNPMEMAMPDADPINDPFIPFEKFGRTTCDDRMTRGPDPQAAPDLRAR